MSSGELIRLASFREMLEWFGYTEGTVGNAILQGKVEEKDRKEDQWDYGWMMKLREWVGLIQGSNMEEQENGLGSVGVPNF